MPNWGENYVVIDCPTESEAKALEEAFEQGRLCDFVAPMPAVLAKIPSPVSYGPSGRACYKDGTELTNDDHAEYTRCGFSSWYEFAHEEWGTKWDVGGDDEYCERIGNILTLQFRSAWSPPIFVLLKLSERNFNVTAFFSEWMSMYWATIWNGEYDRIEEPSDMPSQFWETLVAARLLDSAPLTFFHGEGTEIS